MPRVTEHVSQGRAQGKVRCCRCPEPIVKGEKYYKWAIKSQRGGTVYQQHTSHGHVKQSQLTHSKMSGAYAAIEGAEESLASASDPEEVREALSCAKDEIEAVRDEYQESLDNMPENLQQGDTGQQIQERIDELESFADVLDSAHSEIEDFDDEPVDGEDDEKFQERQADHLQEQIDKAESALGEASF